MILVWILVASIILNMALAAYNRYLDREIEKTRNHIACLEQRINRRGI